MGKFTLKEPEQLGLPLPGEVCKIIIADGRSTLVDAADYEWLSKFRWMGVGNNKAHVGRSDYSTGKLKTIRMHRLIMNAPDGMDVDHRNGDPMDNRRENLRICTSTENRRNTKKYKISSSKFKGITATRNCSRWIATICVDNERVYLGTFSSEIEAARAYDEAARKHFGAFACVNFPLPGERSALAVSHE